jgi:hypothetical protein
MNSSESDIDNIFKNKFDSSAFSSSGNTENSNKYHSRLSQSSKSFRSIIDETITNSNSIFHSSQDTLTKSQLDMITDAMANYDKTQPDPKRAKDEKMIVINLDKSCSEINLKINFNEQLLISK